MALSNIFREPRREITESAVGIGAAVAAVTLLAWVAYLIGQRIHEADNSFSVPVGMVLGAQILLLAGLIGALILTITHWIGEEVCDALERRGLQLRPRERR
jgi:hypothetical protein